MSTYCREALKGGAPGSAGPLGTTRRVDRTASVDGALVAAGIRGGAR
jgi:hypothetical protein